MPLQVRNCHGSGDPKSSDFTFEISREAVRMPRNIDLSSSNRKCKYIYVKNDSYAFYFSCYFETLEKNA